MIDSRRCGICGKREIDAPRKGGITRFFGLWAHPSCFRKEQKNGTLVWEKGKSIKYQPQEKR